MAGFIMALTGNEGDGKSACMAALGRYHLECAARHFNYPNVEAMIAAEEFKKNSPVYCFDGFSIHSPKDDKKLYTTTIKPAYWFADFNNEKWRNHVYLIDEAQQWVDSRDSSSNVNGLFAHAAAQRRRANISILFTCQNIEWMYKRLRWSCHFIARCRDLSRTPWGKKKHIERGELISMRVWDMKGFATGYVGNSVLLKCNAKKIWNYYDSFAPTSLKATGIKQVKEYDKIDWNQPIEYVPEGADELLRNTLAEDDYNSSYIDYDYEPSVGPQELFRSLSTPPDMNASLRERMRYERMKRNAGA